MVTDEKPQILNCNIQFYFKWIVQTITFKLWDKTQYEIKHFLSISYRFRDIQLQSFQGLTLTFDL